MTFKDITAEKSNIISPNGNKQLVDGTNNNDRLYNSNRNLSIPHIADFYPEGNIIYTESEKIVKLKCGKSVLRVETEMEHKLGLGWTPLSPVPCHNFNFIYMLPVKLSY